MINHLVEYLYIGKRLPLSHIFYIEKSYFLELFFYGSCPTFFQITALVQWAFVDVEH